MEHRNVKCVVITLHRPICHLIIQVNFLADGRTIWFITILTKSNKISEIFIPIPKFLWHGNLKVQALKKNL